MTGGVLATLVAVLVLLVGVVVGLIGIAGEIIGGFLLALGAVIMLFLPFL